MTEIADLLDDDTVTKITNLKITNVDMVKRAANGRSWLLRKSADETNPSIFDAEQVRDFAKQAQEGAMSDDNAPVAKADEDILEDAPAGAEGDVNDPGSPAWEAVDAATGAEALSALFQVKRALDVLSDREAEEAFNGDDDGYDNSWDLQNACELVDAAIAIIAPYVASEADESEQPVEKGTADPRADLAEFVSVVKAGRVLSAANESALRGAAAAIQNVLASLPAPVEDVAKAENVDSDSIVDDGIDSVVADVAKAKGEPQVLVYDANGNVIGSVDPGDLTTFANSAPTDAAPDDSADDADDSAADDSADADSSDDSAPAPATPDVADDADENAAVIPGTDTVQSPVEADDDDKTVTKALSTEIAEAFKEALAPFAKQLEETSGLADVVKGLEERIAKMGQMPDDRKSPALNGATGEAGGVTRDGDMDGLEPLRKAVAEAETQDEIIKSKQALAVAELARRTRERFSNN